MRKTSESETIAHLLERLDLTSGAQLLWHSVLSRCASIESSSFLEGLYRARFQPPALQYIVGLPDLLKIRKIFG